MSLSPVSAVSEMVAPVVLITVAALFGNGLLGYGAILADKVFALDRERAGILRGPHGEMLDEDGVPPVDRERLMQIRGQTPLLVGRFRRVRTAILIIWIAIGLLVLSVAAIAVAVTARSEEFAFAALGLVLAGVVAMFAAVAVVIGPAARWADVVAAESRCTGMPD